MPALTVQTTDGRTIIAPPADANITGKVYHCPQCPPDSPWMTSRESWAHHDATGH